MVGPPEPEPTTSASRGVLGPGSRRGLLGPGSDGVDDDDDDDDDDNDEVHAKVTSHETVLTSHETDFCAFHDKIVSLGLMLQQKSVT